MKLDLKMFMDPYNKSNIEKIENGYKDLYKFILTFDIKDRYMFKFVTYFIINMTAFIMECKYVYYYPNGDQQPIISDAEYDKLESLINRMINEIPIGIHKGFDAIESTEDKPRSEYFINVGYSEIDHKVNALLKSRLEKYIDMLHDAVNIMQVEYNKGGK